LRYVENHVFKQVSRDYEDVDHDGLINYKDSDVDGDGLDNIDDDDADGDGVRNQDEIVQAGPRLVGVWTNAGYSFFEDVAGRMGVLRPFEVVSRPYEQVGVFLSDEVRRAGKATPYIFFDSDVESPTNPMFGQSVENLYRYLDSQDKLVWDNTVAVGDIIFVDNNFSQIGLVTAVIPQVKFVVWGQAYVQEQGIKSKHDYFAVARLGSAPRNTVTLGCGCGE
jgi:hypothetical protein